MLELLDSILEKAYSLKATDVHLVSDSVPWFRINTLMNKMKNERFLSKDELFEIFNELNISEPKRKEFKEFGSCDFGYVNDYGTYRINVFIESGLLAMAIRRLPRNIPNISTLNLPESFENLVLYHSGLILVTGATGNGKSTTLSALINKVNMETQKHIITIEDPIEYRYPIGKSLISQREIGTDCVDFYTGFKSSLREDPDVILIGELRDKDTIRTAISAAETGHLVLSTLHTSSASETINRIISYYEGNEQTVIANKLATSLRAVICQVLLPRIDKPGLICASELLLPIVSIQNLIRENKCYHIDSFMKINKQAGMFTLENSLKDLVDKGIVDYDVALNHCNDPYFFKSLFSPLSTPKKK